MAQAISAHYDLIRTTGEFEALCARLTEDGLPFGFDIETSYDGEPREHAQLHPEENFIAGMSFTNSGTWARYAPLRHDSGPNLDNPRCALAFWNLAQTGLGVAHNAKFEKRCMARWFMEYLADHPLIGAEVRASRGYFTVLSCTMLESYAEARNRWHGLKDITQSNFGHKMAEIFDLFPKRTTKAGEPRPLTKKEQSCIRFSELDQTSAKVIAYACEDALWALAHHYRRYPLVKDNFIYQLEMKVLPVVCEMEDEGVLYDWNFMREAAGRARVFLDKLAAEIARDLTRLVRQKDPDAGEIQINLGSPAQIASVLYDQLGLTTRRRTDSGKLSTDEVALTGLAKKYPVVRKILNWKSLRKLLGTYLETYETKFGYAPDGRTHPGWLQHGVPAGRFSASEPPVQQCVPGSYEVLTRDDGWVRFDKLGDSEPVAQYLPDGRIEFVVPRQVVRDLYAGEMVEFRSSGGGTWQYTPNHRIAYRRRLRSSGGSGPVQEMSAVECEQRLLSSRPGLPGRRLNGHRYIKAGSRSGGVELSPRGERRMCLAVACQAEGNRRTDGRRGSVWFDVELRGARKQEQFRLLAQEFGLVPRVTSRSLRYRVPEAVIAGWLDENKDFVAGGVLSLSVGSLRAFVRAVMEWDGDYTRGNTFGQKVSRRRSVDVVQAAAALCGFSTSLYERPEYDAVTVNLCDRAEREAGWQEVSRVPSPGMVYCVTVPSGMFLVRNSQGKVLVTGNSPKKYHYELETGETFDFNFRDAILASAGWYLIGFDYKNQELRVLAGEAQEPALIEAFSRGEDVHRLTASFMTGKSQDQITDDERQDFGKVMNFALSYQMGVDGLAQRLGISKDEAQALFDQYFAVYRRIQAYMERTVASSKALGYITTKFGRVVRIWEYESTNRGIYAAGERLAGNAPIQGAGTGDYTKIAMVRAHDALKQAGLLEKVRLVMNMHDALEFYVREDVPPAEVIRVLQPAVVFPVDGWPPIEAEWQVGRRWGSMKELEVLEDGNVRLASDEKAAAGDPAPVSGAVPAPERPGVPDQDEPAAARAAEGPALAGPGDAAVPAGSGQSAVPVRSRPGDPGGGDHPRLVIVTLPVMPSAETWAEFCRLLGARPGCSMVTVRTPEGETSLGNGAAVFALTPQWEPQVSVLFGGAQVTYAPDSVDTAALASGLSL